MSKHLLDLISDLQNEVNEARKAVEQKEQLLALLLERVGAPTPATADKATIPEDNGIIKLDGLPISKANGKRTLTDEVKDVVSRFGDQEFNVVHVHAVLEQRGIPIAGKLPRARISVSLNDLIENGTIEKTFQGKGNVPNRYKLVQSHESMV